MPPTTSTPIRIAPTAKTPPTRLLCWKNEDAPWAEASGADWPAAMFVGIVPLVDEMYSVPDGVEKKGEDDDVPLDGF